MIGVAGWGTEARRLVPSQNSLQVQKPQARDLLDCWHLRSRPGDSKQPRPPKLNGAYIFSREPPIQPNELCQKSDTYNRLILDPR